MFVDVAEEQRKTTGYFKQEAEAVLAEAVVKYSTSSGWDQRDIQPALDFRLEAPISNISHDYSVDRQASNVLRVFRLVSF
ncbi:hypothetical protein RRG08_029585 [Elysia crispata]|uniref:Uncharacterized protein n=1 Tax=Elysia crispata TaxID=231223 RepID=A0AAE0XP54_9GAST|nr:hypothetical protein RRG08_029585 [Elysia crispata]